MSINNDVLLRTELENMAPKYIKSVCCESYKTPRGRCYSCPEYDLEKKNNNGAKTYNENQEDKEK